MDSRKFIVSNDEKMEDPSNGSDSSKMDSQVQSETVERNPSRTIEEQLPSVGELESSNQDLPSARSVKVSCQPSTQSPTLSSQTPNIDQHNESTPFYSSHESWNRMNYPLNENAFITPRSNPTTSSMSVVEVSDVSGSKTAQSNLSPFSANLNDDFSSPPDRGAILAIKSFSKNLKESNTPSPDKRSVEADVEATPTKRLKITPEIDSRKHGIEPESYRPKSSFSTVAKASFKSPTDLEVQLFKAAIQKTEKSESLNTPSPPNDKRIAKNSSGESKAEDDTCLSSQSSVSPAANIVHKSPTNLQMHDVSSTEKNTSISFQNSSTDPNSLAENCNRDELLPTASLNETESTVSANERGRLPALDISFESERSDVTVKEFELAVHSPKLTDETSSLNPEKSQNSPAAGFESSNKIKKIQDSRAVTAEQSQSNSATGAQILKSHSTSSILNPHLPSSCHLPRCRIPSVSDAPRRILQFETSKKTLRNDETQTSTPDTNSSSQSKELPVSRSRGIDARSLSDRTLVSKYSSESYPPIISQRTFPRSHSKESSTSCSPGMRQRSVSDETLTSRNLTEDQNQQNRHNSRIRSQSKTSSSSSRSLPEISKVSGLFREVTHTSSSNKISAKNNSSSTLRNNTEEQTPLNLSDSLLLPRVASTPRNQPEEEIDIKPPPIRLFKRQPSTSKFQPIVASSTFYQLSTSMFQPIVTGNSSLDQASTSMFQPIVTSNSSLDQASTSRFQPIVTCSSFDPISISSNQPGVVVDINQPSTSRFQPVVTEVATLNQAHFSASTRRYDFNLNRYVPMFEEFSVFTGSCSSDDQGDSSPGTPRASSATPQSGRARGTSEPTPDDEFAEYTDEACIILKAILKKMMLHDGDILIWWRFEREEDSAKLCFLLARYLANRGYKLWSENLLTTHPRTAEACARITYEKLISTVVSTLVLILRQALPRNHSAFHHNYLNFRRLAIEFAPNPAFTNAEDVQDEASRNRVEKLIKMLHTLLLRTSQAFRLILMYVGEKCDEEVIEGFESALREEDKMFLRRKYKD